MTSRYVHVILLRRSPISGDSELSGMGGEGALILETVDHNREKERARARGQHRIVPEMGQNKTQSKGTESFETGHCSEVKRILFNFPYRLHESRVRASSVANGRSR
uniref:Uncharacterized protein n=1 Tax=Knipowitschia caucasica TaxID=637954 RepID=A0AAV2LX48_KNICA